MEYLILTLFILYFSFELFILIVTRWKLGKAMFFHQFVRLSPEQEMYLKENRR